MAIAVSLMLTLGQRCGLNRVPATEIVKQCPQSFEHDVVPSQQCCFAPGSIVSLQQSALAIECESELFSVFICITV
ncbi:hypothetical protein TUM4641_00130 [Shewanella morhuae]|nr:hypothetical protein TUM4641_00130 [Shewanella morhuae]